MDKSGDADDCISTLEATYLASKLSEEELKNLPLPGQVDFINGGPLVRFVKFFAFSEKCRSYLY